MREGTHRRTEAYKVVPVTTWHGTAAFAAGGWDSVAARQQPRKGTRGHPGGGDTSFQLCGPTAGKAVSGIRAYHTPPAYSCAWLHQRRPNTGTPLLGYRSRAAPAHPGQYPGPPSTRTLLAQASQHRPIVTPAGERRPGPRICKAAPPTSQDLRFATIGITGLRSAC